MSRGIAKHLLASLALAALAALAGCASTPGPPNPQLQGAWRLDSAASDNVAALIGNAIRTAQNRRRRRHGGGSGFGPPGAGPGGAGGTSEGPGGEAGGDADEGPQGGAQTGADLDAGGLIGPDFQALRERLQQTLGSPRSLRFRIQGDDVLIQHDDLPARDYQPGESITRFDEYGTAQVRASWKDGGLTIAERFTSGARLEQRYALDAHGALVFTRALRDPTVGRLELKSIYRRTGP